MLIAGIDDAGRGPIIGPLTIAGVLLKQKDLPKLTALGVKDSKLLTPSKRRQLAQEIKKIALKHHITMLSPAEIDKVANKGKKLHRLNRLEAKAMAEVIKILKPNIAYVDASDVLPDRYKDHILEEIPFKVQIISEHKADKKYPIVSAASILAKVQRDKAIHTLKEKYGDLGSGYTSDPKTIKFLKTWIQKQKTYPNCVRKSWKPAKKLKTQTKTKQTKLT